MTEQEFVSLYKEDVDFKALVDYVKSLAKVNRFFSQVSQVKFDKLVIDNVEAKDIQLILDGMYKRKVQSFLEERSTEKILDYANKLLRKELDVVQQNVHD